MSIITRFLSAVTEPEFKLARDLTAMAIADGEITPEEKEAMSTICHLEGIDETKLLESLQGGYERVNAEIPQDRPGKEAYLRKIIMLIGADGYAAPQEAFLCQIIASKLGLNQMDVMSMFLTTANKTYFMGDIGNRVMTSFLRNYIDPKGKTEMVNRQNLSIIYQTVVNYSEIGENDEATRDIIRKNLARATEVFIENKILIKEFHDMRLDFVKMAKEEEMKTLKRYTQIMIS
jgi:uncharacterized tellurite resistance protein B-like protein